MDTMFPHGHPDHDACGTGFIVKLGSGATHDVVERAVVALQRLSHRGGIDADASSGDGAGLLTGIPRRMLTRIASHLRAPLPGVFGLGMLFIQRGDETRVHAAISPLAFDPRLNLPCWS